MKYDNMLSCMEGPGNGINWWTAAKRDTLRKIAGNGKENVVERMMPKASRKVMEKEKMVVNRAMEKAKRRTSIREIEKAKMTKKERRRSSRKTSAIEADRQVAMEAMRAMMVRGALLVAALHKGLL